MRPVVALLVFAILIPISLGCTPEDTPSEEITGPYAISGADVLYNNAVVCYKGVNAMQSFGLTDPELMEAWNIKIVREFIGNLREQPIDGYPVLGSDGAWYHPIQDIVNQNRLHGIITIICPFGWVNHNGEHTLFTGLNPSEQDFYGEYKTKMKQIAEHFKDQADVWIEVWNEPYHWNNENNYTHNLWLFDMTDMVNNLREVKAFNNIIVIPGNEQGQSEASVLAKGKLLLNNNFNLLFDLHAYEKWLNNTTESQIASRLNTLKNKNIPFIIGEVGVQNVEGIMPVQSFLNAAENCNVTTLAWLWNKNSSDNNALLTNDGLPNASIDNNYWGLKYKTFLNGN